MILKDINTILELSRTDFKLRYGNAFFGYLWIIINPLAMLVTLYVVFSLVMKINLDNYQIFLLIGIISWNFFQETTSICMKSLDRKSSLIKKIKFPLHTIILSSSIISSITLIVSLVILLGLIIIFTIKFRLIMLVSLFFIFLLYIFTLGMSYILASIYLFFKDLVHIWNFLLLIGFWITPIVYQETQISLQYRSLYMLNPLARIINHIRDALLNNFFSLEQTIITLIITSSLFFLGLLMFSYVSPKYAEKI